MFHRARVTALVLVGGLLGGAGCGAQAATRRPAFVDDESAAACPLGIRTAVVRVTDAPGGVDLVFTSDTGSGVDEIRIRVRDAMAKHGPGTHSGLGHRGEHGEDHGHGLRLWEPPAATASLEDVERGTRIRLLAADAADEQALRARLRRRVHEIRETPCE